MRVLVNGLEIQEWRADAIPQKFIEKDQKKCCVSQNSAYNARLLSLSKSNRFFNKLDRTICVGTVRKEEDKTSE